MKGLPVVAVAITCGMLFGETSEEAYARALSYRSLWDTNARAYAKLVAIGDDPAVAEAKAKWFVDVLSFPDVTDTNRLDDVLWAKKKIISWNAGSHGIVGNTNCWYAVADFISRLKSAADPKWQSGGEDGPLFDFASYRRECFEVYMRQHTNSVPEATVRETFDR